MSGLAAELSYRSFVATVPWLAVMAAIGALLARYTGQENPAEAFVQYVGKPLPPDVSSFLQHQLEGVFAVRSTQPLLLGLAGAVATGTLVMGTVRKALNRIYGREDSQSLPRRLLISAALALVAGVFIATAVVLVFTSDWWAGEITWLRWPGALLLAIAAATLVYWAAPDQDKHLPAMSFGALAFGSAWVLGSAALFLYVRVFGVVNSAYGALGALLILLGWYYLTAVAFLVGALFNAAIEHQAPEQFRKEGAGASAITRPGDRRPEPVRPQRQ